MLSIVVCRSIQMGTYSSPRWSTRGIGDVITMFLAFGHYSNKGPIKSGVSFARFFHDIRKSLIQPKTYKEIRAFTEEPYEVCLTDSWSCLCLIMLLQLLLHYVVEIVLNYVVVKLWCCWWGIIWFSGKFLSFLFVVKLWCCWWGIIWFSGKFLSFLCFEHFEII
jgi:hypothetical protein